MTHLRAVEATIERRILLNYRVDAEVLAGLLPAPFRPTLVDGYGLAGVCLIRLGRAGMSTENAAHRVAVEWDGGRGVYILRRDTESRLTALAGGRLFPGWHHRARFAVRETPGGRYRIVFESRDGEAGATVTARRASSVMAGSVFGTVEDASRFFCDAPDGYSVTPAAGVLDGVRLTTVGWSFEPLTVDEARSTFYDDGSRFPPGTIALDSAFLMAGLASRWEALPDFVLPGHAPRPGPWRPRHAALPDAAGHVDVGHPVEGEAVERVERVGAAVAAVGVQVGLATSSRSRAPVRSSSSARNDASSSSGAGQSGAIPKCHPQYRDHGHPVRAGAVRVDDVARRAPGLCPRVLRARPRRRDRRDRVHDAAQVPAGVRTGDQDRVVLLYLLQKP